MKRLTSPPALRQLLEKHNFSLSKALGQNFLTDKNIIGKIIEAASVSEQDLIIEVGPGAGILTRSLAEVARAVVAIEIDGGLLPVLGEILEGYGNVHIISGDALKIDLGIIREKMEGIRPPKGTSHLKLVANLPYYITSPLLVRFLTWDVRIDSMVLMVQKEVADRLAAPPGGKRYGSISVLTQYYSKPILVHRVPPNVFYPPPDVESAIIKLDVYEEPKVKVRDENIFFGLVRAAFGKRRKTLLNALSGAPPDSVVSGVPRDAWKDVLREAGVDPTRRGETLTLQEFADISNIVERRSTDGLC